MKHLFSIFLLTFLWTSLHASASESRDKYNFNSGWLLSVGDKSGAEKNKLCGCGLERSDITLCFQ